MIKQISSLIVKVDEKNYEFLCQCDSPLGSVYDALSQMRAYVIERINEAQKAERPKNENPESIESGEANNDNK